MKLLKYESSTEIIMLGPIVKSTDGYSRSTALSLTTAPAIRMSKKGSTFVNRNDTGAVTARYGGYYTVPLSTVDTGTYGHLRVMVQTSAARMADAAFDFLTDNIIEGSQTNRDIQRLMQSVLCGQSTGAGSTTLKFYGINSTGIIRVQAECGSSGNRKGITLKSTS
jgi:hypothetical protein